MNINTSTVNTNILNLKANLLLPISERKSETQRNADKNWDGQMSFLASIRSEIPALNPKDENDNFDTSPYNGDSNRGMQEYSIGQI